ncbi:MAG: FkbM family methyltransferase [Reyranella sp.]
MDLYPNHLASWSRSRVERAVRHRARAVYLGDGVVLARVLGRHKILLRGRDRGFAGHLMIDGFWEIWLTQFFARCLRPGMNAVDVGANFGYHTLLLADAVGPSGTVIAVEPNPDTVTLLGQTVALNGLQGRVKVIPHALGAKSGSAFLFAPEGEPKNALLVDHAKLPGGRTFEVKTLTLDDVTRNGPKIDVVKIDAEGAEVGVIAGMARLIARDRPAIALEFNAARYRAPAEFLNLLLASYGDAREMTLDGNLVPLDFASVTDRSNTTDRYLMFGFDSLREAVDEPAQPAPGFASGQLLDP